MTRTSATWALLLAAASLTGCAIHPGCVDPYDGIARGYSFEAVPGGPFDPHFWLCDIPKFIFWPFCLYDAPPCGPSCPPGPPPVAPPMLSDPHACAPPAMAYPPLLSGAGPELWGGGCASGHCGGAYLASGYGEGCGPGGCSTDVYGGYSAPAAAAPYSGASPYPALQPGVIESYPAVPQNAAPQHDPLTPVPRLRPMGVPNDPTPPTIPMPPFAPGNPALPTIPMPMNPMPMNPPTLTAPTSYVVPPAHAVPQNYVTHASYNISGASPTVPVMMGRASAATTNVGVPAPLSPSPWGMMPGNAAPAMPGATTVRPF